jgi:hypothetical protein
MALASVTWPRDRRQQSRNAQHRILVERQRVEEVIIDAPVDHIDPLRALRRAHEHRFVLDEEVLPSTSSIPICCARKVCSKYALL